MTLSFYRCRLHGRLADANIDDDRPWAVFAWLSAEQAHGYADPETTLGVFLDAGGEMIPVTVRLDEIEVLEEA